MNNQANNQVASKVSNTEVITALLNAHVNEAEKVRTAVIDSLSRGSSLSYVLQWAESEAVTTALGELSGAVLADVESHKVSVEEALEYHYNEVRNALLDDRFTGKSTSPFSNAMEGATRAAYARFLRVFKRVL